MLQYLSRDAKYQSRHVYVDEFTAHFLSARGGPFFFTRSSEKVVQMLAEEYTNNIAQAEADYESFLKTDPDHYRLGEMLGTVSALDEPPAYRQKWNLAEDSKLNEGVVYMASLNPVQPSCFEMLGIVAWKKGDLNLAATAFEKAIQLNSSQTLILKSKVKMLREHVLKAQQYRKEEQWPVFVAGIAIVGASVLYVAGRFRRKRPSLPSGV